MTVMWVRAGTWTTIPKTWKETAELIWLGLVSWHINHCRLFNAKSSLHIHIKYIWFGLVLWHINHYRLFNAKSSLHIHIKYIWFGLVLWHINHYRLFNAKSSLYIRFGLVVFYSIATIVDYLMPNSVYTYILDIYDLSKKFKISNNWYVSLIIQLNISHLFTHS